jgi:hypothetical protein
MSKPHSSFREWYEKWQMLAIYTGSKLDDKERDNRINKIIHLWSEEPPPGEWRRKFENDDFNLRGLCTPGKFYCRTDDKSPNAGEHQIENQIIESKDSITFFSDEFHFEPIVNAFPCAKVTRGKVEFDMLSLLKTPAGSIHPLVCEIKTGKTGSKNSWYATIENLRQLRLFIGNRENNLQVIQAKRKDLSKTLFGDPVGIVIAEPDYYMHRGQKSNSMEPTRELIKRLQSSPNCKSAKVILTTWNMDSKRIDRCGGCELNDVF